MARHTISTEDVKTPEQIKNEEFRAAMAMVAGRNLAASDSIARHAAKEEQRVSLPDGMPTSKAAKIVAEAAADEQEVKEFNLVFNANKWDGAVAFQHVLKTYFGSNGRSVSQFGFFGQEYKPEILDIEVGFGKTVQVTWGKFEFTPLEGTIVLGSQMHPDFGEVFKIYIQCPKKFAASVEGLKRLIDDELKENSIYKGQAIRSTPGDDKPRFIDLQVDNSVVYNDDVYARLDRAVWANLRHTSLLRNDREAKIDPRVLLFGPYGTGKSECGRLTARQAVDNGWTFISYDSGRGSQEDLRRALQTARLFAPSVVFVEDIDIYAEAADSGHARSRLLEMFDGISSKNAEVMVVMTSNKAERLDKGMLRPGRIDAMIEIGALNRKAAETLIRKVNEGQLAEDVDFDAIYEEVKDFEPAFLRRTFVDARQYAMVRTADELVTKKGTYSEREAHEFLLTTEDFVNAARYLGDQHDRHSNAADESPKRTIDDLIKESVATSLAHHVDIEDANGPVEVTIKDAGTRSESIKG